MDMSKGLQSNNTLSYCQNWGGVGGGEVQTIRELHVAPEISLCFVVVVVVGLLLLLLLW